MTLSSKSNHPAHRPYAAQHPTHLHLAGTPAGNLGSAQVEFDHIAQATQKLIDDLRIMKRTRFNAQARFEAKHAASVTAFTLATVIEIGLSLAGVNFGSSITSESAAFIEYASQVTAIFILGFGLVVGLGNYQTRALYMQRCAMDWGSLSRELQIARPVDRTVLQDYRRRYHEIEGQCPPNHSDIDYRRAIQDKQREPAKRANGLDYLIEVYGIYAVSGVGYFVFWYTLWQVMTP